MGLKVLHVLNHSLPQADGYAIRSANIIRFQRELGLETLVVTSSAHPSDVIDNEVIDGVRYWRTRSAKYANLPFLDQLQAIRGMAARIDTIVQSQKPDILHAHSPCLWGEAAARVARRHGLPLVYEIRGFWEDAAVDQGKTRPSSARYRLSRALETRVARKADAVVTIADLLRTDLVSRGIENSKISVVPNGVDTDRFRPTPPDSAIESHLSLNGQFRIGYVGTLYPWEGVDDLIAATRIIAREHPAVRVVIVGGQNDDRLQNLVRQYEVEDKLILVGSIPHTQVVSYYSIMDMLVYPRKKTRNTDLVTPLKPLEAMAMEKPVIGSDVGGFRELLGSFDGLQFGAGDVNALARTCLDLLLSERRLETGKAAREYVIAHRNWASIIPRYLTIYESVVAKRR